MTGKISDKGYANSPLTEKQKESNRIKSKIRSRVEHVFGFMEDAMHGLTARTVGLPRACENIFMTCLIYNMFRMEQIFRLGIN